MNHNLLHFSPHLFWLFQRNLVRILLGVRGAFFRNMTSNDLDHGNGSHFQNYLSFLVFWPCPRRSSVRRRWWISPAPQGMPPAPSGPSLLLHLSLWASTSLRGLTPLRVNVPLHPDSDRPPTIWDTFVPRPLRAPVCTMFHV